MKLFSSLILAGLLTGSVFALDSAKLAEVANKLTSQSMDEQFAARIELNRLVDDATAPGKDYVAVTKTLLAALQSKQIPHEAKKYILRKLAHCGTAEAVAPMAALLKGADPLFKEEARRVLEEIRDPKAVAVLEGALKSASDQRDKLSFINSLAMQGATSSVQVIQHAVVDPDEELARAAVQALAKIGGSEAVTVLGKAAASSKVAPALKADIEKALLIAGSGDANVMVQVYKSTQSDTVRLAAFKVVAAGTLDASKTAVIVSAVGSSDDTLRQAALVRGLEAEIPSLVQGLAQAFDQLPVGDRLVVLSAIHHVQPAATAEKIALSSVKSTDEDEQVAAIAALGRIGTKPAFDAVLIAVGTKAPRVNQAAGSALASMNYDGADTALLGMLKGSDSDAKVLAAKAVAHRQVPGVNAVLLDVIKGSNQNAAKEAMKTIFAIATIDDLRTIVATAKTTTDAGQKRMLTAACAKIAERLNTDDAKQLAESLN